MVDAREVLVVFRSLTAPCRFETAVAFSVVCCCCCWACLLGCLQLRIAVVQLLSQLIDLRLHLIAELLNLRLDGRTMYRFPRCLMPDSTFTRSVAAGSCRLRVAGRQGRHQHTGPHRLQMVFHSASLQKLSQTGFPKL